MLNVRCTSDTLTNFGMVFHHAIFQSYVLSCPVVSLVGSFAPLKSSVGYTGLHVWFDWLWIAISDFWRFFTQQNSVCTRKDITGRTWNVVHVICVFMTRRSSSQLRNRIPPPSIPRTRYLTFRRPLIRARRVCYPSVCTPCSSSLISRRVHAPWSVCVGTVPFGCESQVYVPCYTLLHHAASLPLSVSLHCADWGKFPPTLREEH